LQAERDRAFVEATCCKNAHRRDVKTLRETIRDLSEESSRSRQDANRLIANNRELIHERRVLRLAAERLEEARRAEEARGITTDNELRKVEFVLRCKRTSASQAVEQMCNRIRHNTSARARRGPVPTDPWDSVTAHSEDRHSDFRPNSPASTASDR
jgi:hypothetical protein